MHRQTSLPLFVSLLSIAILLSACGGARTAPPTLPATAPPTVAPPTAAFTPVPPTATLAPTDTPVPAPTQIPTPNPTALAETQAAETQTAALAAIEPDLKKYGFSTSQGRLGWVHRPVTLSVDKYYEYKVEVDYPDLSVADFVVQADITWNTSSGLAGCGFAVRADPDFGRRIDYEMVAVRLSGDPYWFLSLFKGGVYGNFIGNGDAPTLSVDLDSTNTIALVGKGSRFTTYANGFNAGSVTHSELREGTVGFLAKQESGRTTCTFENAWMWVLDD